jgi:hypothetical protein
MAGDYRGSYFRDVERCVTLQATLKNWADAESLNAQLADENAVVEGLDDGVAHPMSTTTCTCRQCGAHVEVGEEVLESLARDLLSRRNDCRQTSPP